MNMYNRVLLINHDVLLIFYVIHLLNIILKLLLNFQTRKGNKFHEEKHSVSSHLVSGT